jgi:hypothetical protein
MMDALTYLHGAWAMTDLTWHRIGVMWFLAPSRSAASAACNAAADACNFGAKEDGGIVVVKQGRRNVGVLWVLADSKHPLRIPQLPRKFYPVPVEVAA